MIPKWSVLSFVFGVSEVLVEPFSDSPFGFRDVRAVVRIFTDVARNFVYHGFNVTPTR